MWGEKLWNAVSSHSLPLDLSTVRKYRSVYFCNYEFFPVVSEDQRKENLTAFRNRNSLVHK